MLTDILAGRLAEAGFDGQTPMPALFAVLLSIPVKRRTMNWGAVLLHPAAERLLGVHAFEGTRWFRKESLDMFAACVAVLFRVKTGRLVDSARKAGYRWDDFLTSMKAPAR